MLSINKDFDLESNIQILKTLKNIINCSFCKTLTVNGWHYLLFNGKLSRKIIEEKSKLSRIFAIFINKN